MNESVNQKYQDTLAWLYQQLPMFSRTGAAAYKPGLDTSLALDEFFGHPHRNFKSIHVAGTNGKGSVSHNLAAILQSQGYRTGLYTSPHLADFRERIRVNGEMIPQEAVTDFVKRFRASDYAGHPSFFELTMMMAFDWFARSEVEYAVIETGMGGRLDSTNIITPQACIITNISKDHTQFLGATLPEIAAEKAGIIKRHIPVTIGEADGEVRSVFERKATEVNAPITFAGDTPAVSGAFDLSNFTDSKGRRLSSPLLGDYQHKNINTVLIATEMLRNVGIELSDDAIISGIRDVVKLTHLAGRWMRIHEQPIAIADTGHNEAGLGYNMEQLRRMMSTGKYRTLRMMLGFVADKDIDNILKLLPHDATLYICNASIPRALAADQLAQRCRAAGLTVDDSRIRPDVASSWRQMLSESTPEDLLYVGGSTFVVADLLPLL